MMDPKTSNKGLADDAICLASPLHASPGFPTCDLPGPSVVPLTHYLVPCPPLLHADQYPAASWKWPGSHGKRCSAGLCFRCRLPGSPHAPAALVPGVPQRPGPGLQAPPANFVGWTLETTPWPPGALRPSETGKRNQSWSQLEAGRMITAHLRRAVGTHGAVPLWRREYNVGPTLTGTGFWGSAYGKSWRKAVSACL